MTDPVPSKELDLPSLKAWLRERHAYLVGLGAQETYEGFIHAHIERLQAREREAFRLANAATYLVAPKYSLHSELKAFMDGQVGKPDDSAHEPPASRNFTPEEARAYKAFIEDYFGTSQPPGAGQ